MGNICSTLCGDQDSKNLRNGIILGDNFHQPDEELLPDDLDNSEVFNHPTIDKILPLTDSQNPELMDKMDNTNVNIKKSFFKQTVIQMQQFKKLHHPKKKSRHFSMKQSIFNDIPCRAKEDVYKVYQFKGKLGSGEFGEVFLAQLHSDQNRKFAIKVIDRRKDVEYTTLFLNEIEMLKEVDHPNIIKFFEVYESETRYFLV